MFSAIGGIVGGIASIFTTVIGGRTQKSLQKRAIRGASSLLNTEYKYKSEELKAQADIVTSQQQFELEKIKLEKEPSVTPYSLQNSNPETSFFDSIEETTGINPVYILIVVILLVFLLIFRKKK